MKTLFRVWCPQCGRAAGQVGLQDGTPAFKSRREKLWAELYPPLDVYQFVCFGVHKTRQFGTGRDLVLEVDGAELVGLFERVRHGEPTKGIVGAAVYHRGGDWSFPQDRRHPMFQRDLPEAPERPLDGP